MGDSESRCIPPGWPTDYEWPLARERFEVRKDLEFFQSYFGPSWYSALMDWERPCPLLHRDKLLNDLRVFLGIARTANSPPNIVLSGGPGTCKSAGVDAILSELLGSDDPGLLVGFVRFVWNKTARFASVVEPIRLQFERKMQTGQLRNWPPARVPLGEPGSAADSPRNLIVVVEEADEGPPGQGISDVGELNRMREWDGPVRASAIVLCRSVETCRVPVVTNTSRGAWVHVDARPYTFSQLKDIVQARVERSFPAGRVAADAVTRCAETVHRTTGDPRDAFRLLCNAADLAVERRASRITQDQVEEAIWREPWRWDGR